MYKTGSRQVWILSIYMFEKYLNPRPTFSQVVFWYQLLLPNHHHATLSTTNHDCLWPTSCQLYCCTACGASQSQVHKLKVTTIKSWWVSDQMQWDCWQWEWWWFCCGGGEWYRERREEGEEREENWGQGKKEVFFLVSFVSFSSLTTYSRKTRADWQHEDNVENAKGTPTQLQPCVF